MASSRSGGTLPTFRVEDGDLDPLDPLPPPDLDRDIHHGLHRSTVASFHNSPTTHSELNTTHLPTRSIAFGQVCTDDGITLGPVVSASPPSTSFARTRRSESGFLGLDSDLDPLTIVDASGPTGFEGKGQNSVQERSDRVSDRQAENGIPLGVRDYGRPSTSLDSQHYRQASQHAHFEHDSQRPQHPGLTSLDSDETTQSESSIPIITASVQSSSSSPSKSNPAEKQQGGKGVAQTGASTAGGASGAGPKFARGTNELLKKITLEEVLDGSSCSPISFREFQQFVTHKEFTTENLLFTIWFRSYRRRFSELEESERLKVDAPSDRLGDTLSPFGYLNKSAGGRRKTLLALVRGDSGTSSSLASGLGPGGESGITEQRERSGSIPLRSMLKRVGSMAGKGGEGQVGPSPMPHTLTTGSASTTFSPPTSPRSFGGQGLPRYAASPPPPTHLALSVGVPSSAYLPTIDPRDQPMRKEAQRAFDTFLRPGSARELNVTDEMRTRCRIALESSTHPDVFLPVYKEVYGFLEIQTLPHFLSYAQSNINFPKQLFWYGVGLTDVSIGILILVLMIYLLPGRSFAWRAPRLVSVLFASFGAMQTYSAWRGFCTQVWGRTSRQLHPWELELPGDDGDEEEDRSRDPKSRSMDLEAGWINPWADSSDRTSEKRSIEVPADGISLSPPFGISSVPEHGDEPGLHRRSTQTQEVDWEGSPPGIAIGRSTGDISDISPWDEPPIQSGGTGGGGNSKTHLIFPVAEKDESEGFSSAYERRQSADRQQNSLLRRILRERKPTKPVNLPKPPIFGDEIVIVDERVIKAHADIVCDILVVGAIFAVIWIALCLAIPPM